MRSAPPSWKYTLPSKPVGASGATRRAGCVELGRGGFSMVPRLLESPAGLRRLGQLQEREAVLLRARMEKLESSAVARGRRDDVELDSAIPREHEVPRRSELELRVARRPRCLAESDRLGRVMGEQLGVVDEPRSRHHLDPVGDGQMLHGTGRTGNLAVCHVADERVPERVFGLALDGREPRGPQELLPRELVKTVADALFVALAHRLECTCPEDLADDGRILEQRLPRRAAACRAAQR